MWLLTSLILLLCSIEVTTSSLSARHASLHRRSVSTPLSDSYLSTLSECLPPSLSFAFSNTSHGLSNSAERDDNTFLVASSEASTSAQVVSRPQKDNRAHLPEDDEEDDAAAGKQCLGSAVDVDQGSSSDIAYLLLQQTSEPRSTQDLWKRLQYVEYRHVYLPNEHSVVTGPVFKPLRDTVISIAPYKGYDVLALQIAKHHRREILVAMSDALELHAIIATHIKDVTWVDSSGQAYFTTFRPSPFDSLAVAVPEVQKYLESTAEDPCESIPSVSQLQARPHKDTLIRLISLCVPNDSHWLSVIASIRWQISVSPGMKLEEQGSGGKLEDGDDLSMLRAPTFFCDHVEPPIDFERLESPDSAAASIKVVDTEDFIRACSCILGGRVIEAHQIWVKADMMSEWSNLLSWLYSGMDENDSMPRVHATANFRTDFRRALYPKLEALVEEAEHEPEDLVAQHLNEARSDEVDSDFSYSPHQSHVQAPVQSSRSSIQPQPDTAFRQALESVVFDALNCARQVRLLAASKSHNRQKVPKKYEDYCEPRLMRPYDPTRDLSDHRVLQAKSLSSAQWRQSHLVQAHYNIIESWKPTLRPMFAADLTVFAKKVPKSRLYTKPGGTMPYYDATVSNAVPITPIDAHPWQHYGGRTMMECRPFDSQEAHGIAVAVAHSSSADFVRGNAEEIVWSDFFAFNDVDEPTRTNLYLLKHEARSIFSHVGRLEEGKEYKMRVACSPLASFSHLFRQHVHLSRMLSTPISTLATGAAHLWPNFWLQKTLPHAPAVDSSPALVVSEAVISLFVEGFCTVEDGEVMCNLEQTPHWKRPRDFVLTEAQASARRHLLSLQPGFSTIWGPFGCGKTGCAAIALIDMAYVLATIRDQPHLIDLLSSIFGRDQKSIFREGLQAWNKVNRVAMFAGPNCAVDHLEDTVLEGLGSQWSVPEIWISRYGYGSCDGQPTRLRPVHSSRRVEGRPRPDPILISATLGSADSPKIRSLEPSIFVIDEAGRLGIMDLAVMSTFDKARTVMFAGDDYQLSPHLTLVEQAKVEQYDPSALQISKRHDAKVEAGRASATFFLSLCYRCNPVITRIASSIFYEDRVTAHPSTSRLYESQNAFPPSLFLNVPPPLSQMPKQMSSVVQTQVAFAVMEEIHFDEGGIGKGTLMIVTPYTEQALKMHDALLKAKWETSVVIKTVSSAQASQAPVVIFIIGDEDPTHSSEFWSLYRFNVGITRAQGVQLTIGNGRCFNRAREHVSYLAQHSARGSVWTIDGSKSIEEIHHQLAQWRENTYSTHPDSFHTG